MIEKLHGGSSNFILLLENHQKQKSVRKVALRDGVEGNGIPKLVREIEFLKYIQHNIPELSKLYVTVNTYKVDRQFAYYDMNYIGEGKNLFQCLSLDFSINEFFQVLEELLDIIIPYGYIKNIQLVRENDSHELLNSMLINRAIGRMLSLSNYRDTKFKSIINVFKKKSLVMNNTVYEHPLSILEKISVNENLREIFRPRSIGTCVHGDLTFMNMVWDNLRKSIRLIDPRGLIGHMDPLYDFGKMKFSLNGFSSIIYGHYKLWWDDWGKISLTITEEESTRHKIQNINDAFLERIKDIKTFSKIIEMEPYWRERILLYEAIHYLADIPFRLYTDGNSQNAISCYLLGTKYLNQVYQQICDINK